MKTKKINLREFEELVRRTVISVINEESWGQDGGWIDKPEMKVYVSREEADFIKSVIKDFKKEMNDKNGWGFHYQEKGPTGMIKRELIKYLKDYDGIELDNDVDDEGNTFIFPRNTQDIEELNKVLDRAHRYFYDGIKK